MIARLDAIPSIRTPRARPASQAKQASQAPDDDGEERRGWAGKSRQAGR